MCEVGDIILVYNAKNKGKPIGPHQFIVLDDEPGKVKGLDYDLISSIMSSIDSNSKIEKLNKYPGNFSITLDDRRVEKDNLLPAFVKLDQLYYLKLDKISYKVLGHINPDIMELLFEYTLDLQDKGVEFIEIIDNL